MPRWLTRAMLIPIALIVLIGVYAVSITGQKDREGRLRAQKEIELSNKMVELTEKEAEIAELNKQKTAIEEDYSEKTQKLENELKVSQADIASHQKQIEDLTRDNESLMKDVVKKDKKIASLSRKIEELESERDQLSAAIKKLEVEKAQAAATAVQPESESATPYGSQPQTAVDLDPVKLGQIVVQKTSGRLAQVQHVDALYGFIVINAGLKDGLRTDAVLNIIRDKKIIGKAVVQKVRRDVAAAVLLPEWTQSEVQVGDLISQF